MVSEQSQQIDMLKQLLAEARAERDQALAHDRQPYPTAWAYEQACMARDEWQRLAEAAHARVTELESPERIESHAVEPDKDGEGDWYVLMFVNGRRVMILTQHPVVVVEPETH